MHFSRDDVLFGYPVSVVQDLTQKVDRAQWCSDGKLADYLQIELADLRNLTDRMRDDGYLVSGGILPAGYEGEWLP